MSGEHTFIGLPLPDKVRSLLVTKQEQLNVFEHFKRCTHIDDFHITLAFLGGVSDEGRDRLDHQIRKIAEQMSPFSLTLSHVGIFGSVSEPRVVWGGIEEQAALNDLHQQVQTMLQNEGYSVDKRPFRPHITLAKKNKRSSSSFAIDRQNLTLEPMTWNVENVCIFTVSPTKEPMYKKVSNISIK
ncbi:RNA 2',3'-cyclic phosphodiesterase [Texcoconibacillus texcoconensis]|uniref:RNA 2',3'-cyclic phosphodiesterase n=1 Tax=Texcoconibacillus texcoconensis TaxID=1095777 RepID=A0A840QN49_9BACI|nr:RNA 2',3'-cyclic phosphodiesterase [Texcoconibacillus texcoconensis]MBB5172799.1 2'-5' RNA ligase [Texcoconibacillus texcoconensis]